MLQLDAVVQGRDERMAELTRQENDTRVRCTADADIARALTRQHLAANVTSQRNVSDGLARLAERRTAAEAYLRNTDWQIEGLQNEQQLLQQRNTELQEHNEVISAQEVRDLLQVETNYAARRLQLQNIYIGSLSDQCVQLCANAVVNIYIYLCCKNIYDPFSRLLVNNPSCLISSSTYPKPPHSNHRLQLINSPWQTHNHPRTPPIIRPLSWPLLRQLQPRKPKTHPVCL